MAACSGAHVEVLAGGVGFTSVGKVQWPMAACSGVHVAALAGGVGFTLPGRCNDPWRHARACTSQCSQAAKRTRMTGMLCRRGGAAVPASRRIKAGASCRFSFQRPDADDAHHAGVHVVEQVAVERPVAGRVGGQVEVDVAAGQDAHRVLAAAGGRRGR